jgi:FAD/FMN-containing dehydrogenase
MKRSVVIFIFCYIVQLCIASELFKNASKSQNKSRIIEQCIQVSSQLTVQFIPVKSSFYNDSRIGVNFRYDFMYPLLIVNVTHWKDVQASVNCAREFGVEINIMNGGHSFEGASCTNGILLHMDSFSDIISHRIYRVQSNQLSYIKIQAGMRLARLYGLVAEINQNYTNNPQSSSTSNNNISESASQKGIYVLGAGTCPTVGVTGHVLCGTW